MRTLSESLSTDELTPYRCYLMDEIGHILAVAVVNCGDEASAIQEAATKFQDDLECRVMEVWEIGRRIARLRRAGVVGSR
jgi:hypothetical protein